jgi:hypothetical protein
MSETFNKYLSISIKLILLLSIINSINLHLWHIASTNIFLLLLTFTPQILNKSIKLKFPKQLELLLIVFVIITLFMGKINIVLAPILFGLGTGLIGLLISYILYSSNQIKRNYFIILLFSFTFAMTFGIALELLKFYLKKILNIPINETIYTFTMMNLTYVFIGAIIASIIGFIYMKTRFKFIEKILKKIIKVNPDLFKKSNSLKEIVKEIKEGEGETQEFKSTLRTNLHINQPDKKIEHTILKTITGFLNSKGGILYIGITDEGKVLGIEKDNFENTDKFHLHFTNLFKQKIGKKYLNLINSKTIQIKNRHIFRIECKQSKNPIFIKDGQEEFFYTRIGPQTTELKGSELIEYVEKRFGKK